MKTYRVAIVGLGRMGSTIDDDVETGGLWPPNYGVPVGEKVSIAGVCRASNRLELAAGADTAPEQREDFRRRWGVDAVYEDYREMIERERPDMVAVCTDGPDHAEMGVATANAGVPMLYLEKVIGCSMAEADAVLEACRRNGTVFNSGVLRRFDSRYQTLRFAIERGAIGEPRAVVFYGAMELIHNHIHTIDTISYFLGDPGIEAVRGEFQPRGWEIENNRIDIDPQGDFGIIFANGVKACSVPAAPMEYEIVGTEGSIRTFNNGGGVLMRKARETIERHGRQQWEEIEPPKMELRNAVAACLEDLVDAHESGGSTLGNVETAHHITEAVFAAAESHRLGGAWVKLPLKAQDLYVFHK